MGAIVSMGAALGFLVGVIYAATQAMYETWCSTCGRRCPRWRHECKRCRKWWEKEGENILRLAQILEGK